MRKLLERSPNVVIVIELWPWGFGHAGTRWQDFFSLLEKFSMQAQAFDGINLFYFCQNNELNPQGYTNIVIQRKYLYILPLTCVYSFIQSRPQLRHFIQEVPNS